MKTLLIIVSILGIVPVADAKEIFKNIDIKEMRVVEIKDGKAVVQHKNGKKAEASIDDHIGKNRIVEIGNTFITVETDTGRTRMPITHGFEQR